MAGQRNHHLGPHVHPLAGHSARRLEDRPYLHSGEIREHDAQAHAAGAEHRVRLVEGFDTGEQLLLFRDLRKQPFDLFECRSV